MNSVVRPIFNEKIAKKWSLWDPWIVHGCTIHCWLGQQLRLKQKKKKVGENIDLKSKPGSKPTLS